MSMFSFNKRWKKSHRKTLPVTIPMFRVYTFIMRLMLSEHAQLFVASLFLSTTSFAIGTQMPFIYLHLFQKLWIQDKLYAHSIKSRNNERTLNTFSSLKIKIGNVWKEFFFVDKLNKLIDMWPRCAHFANWMPLSRSCNVSGCVFKTGKPIEPESILICWANIETESETKVKQNVIDMVVFLCSFTLIASFVC